MRAKLTLSYGRLPAKSVPQLTVELHESFAFQWLFIHAERNVLNAARIESRARLVQAHEARSKKPGAHDQHKRERHLAGHHDAGQHACALMRLRGVLPALDVIVQPARCGLQCGDEPDEKRSHDRCNCRESEDADIQ